MSLLDLVTLSPLMERTQGAPEVVIGLIDGPIALGHPALAGARLRLLSGAPQCSHGESLACTHGTFVAGILAARRESAAPAICPACTLLARPIFMETQPPAMPSAGPSALAAAILEIIAAGARILNLSAALTGPPTLRHEELRDALDHACRRGVLVVAAAGNEGAVGGSLLTRHPWVIPVAACDAQGRPAAGSNLGSSIARGVRAPGAGVTSLGADGGTLTLGGTSVAAPFVTGAAALLWAERPEATAAQVRHALTQSRPGRRTSIVPPLLDAWAAQQTLAALVGR